VPIVLNDRIDMRAATLLDELGHALGCCTDSSTSGGHIVGPNRRRILCSTQRAL